jgi:CRP-like cAMP-binding protein
MFTSLIHANIAKHVVLTESELRYFTELLQPRQLRKDEFLLRAGDVCRHEGFVNQGCLRIYHIDPHGSEHVLYFATEDWWVADVASFIHQSPATLSIQAIEPSEVLLIDKADKERLYVEIPKFERLFRIMTQKTHAVLQQRLLATMSQNAGERYLDLTRRYPHIQKRVPQHQIASYLGISPEFLCKIRKRLSEPS